MRSSNPAQTSLPSPLGTSLYGAAVYGLSLNRARMSRAISTYHPLSFSSNKSIICRHVGCAWVADFAAFCRVLQSRRVDLVCFQWTD